MHCIDSLQCIVICLLGCGKFGARGGKRPLRGIEFALARCGLLLCRGMRITRIEYILLRQPGVVTRLLQFAVRHAGAILALLQSVAVIFSQRRYGHGRRTRGKQHNRRYPKVSIHVQNPVRRSATAAGRHCTNTVPA